MTGEFVLYICLAMHVKLISRPPSNGRVLKIWYALFWLLMATGLTGKPALAQTAITIDDNTKAFQARQLQGGAIGVSVSYAPDKLESGAAEGTKNLRYQISYQGQVKVKGEDLTFLNGEVALQDLDGDRTPEVLVRTFSGGAHCCTNIKIYAWRSDRFTKTETGFLDSQGGTFKDLNGDGKPEFLTNDNAFLYTFSSYAGSFPPSVIYAFRNGQLEDVTRQHPKYLRTRLQDMFKTFQAIREKVDVNGLLAGYVAQKALVGEFKSGWDFMLANYDRTSAGGLVRYDDKGRESGRYPNFPAALKALLIKRGYLDAQGRSR
jgi:hypothetical protein